MPEYSADGTTAPGAASRAPGRHPRARHRVGPAELASWLTERTSRLAELWWAEILAREVGPGVVTERVLRCFVVDLVGMLPLLLGPRRELLQPLWTRTAELFGTMAAKRGLAAGEVIEEFHLLRELVIRELYREPPLDARFPLSLREVLRLSRALDAAVTHASVGHTDAMFFQFFEADGAAPASQADIAGEAERELETIHAEVAAILAHEPSAMRRRVERS